MNEPVGGRHGRSTIAALALLIVVFLEVSSFAQWTTQVSGPKARLRGLCVVSDQIVWASGTQGTCVLTLDGGNTWKIVNVPGAEDLDFRDVHALDSRVVHLLSIGEGEKSRIYQTTDGSATWTRP